jgi:cytochrome c oxidase assembly protein subunit 15
VAGLNAGTIYNTFPLMGSSLIPPGYFEMQPPVINLFENPAAAQFNHRMIAIATFLLVLYVFFWSRVSRKSLQSAGEMLPGAARNGINLTALAGALQVCLGIATLLSGASLVPAVLHQIGAVLLLTGAVVAVRALRP